MVRSEDAAHDTHCQGHSSSFSRTSEQKASHSSKIKVNGLDHSLSFKASLMRLACSLTTDQIVFGCRQISWMSSFGPCVEASNLGATKRGQ